MFQGPLDLLLFLIKKNEIDIYDIPIEIVTRQYLDILNGMENVDLELTGEFFVMAATLMLIKSRMLLPKHIQLEVEEEEIEEEDPRWELVQQLIEYKKLKEQAEELGFLISQANDLVQREIQKEASDNKEVKIKNSDRMEIWNFFNKVLQRLAENIVVGEIHEEQVSVAEQMSYILTTLGSRKEFLFSSLFEEKQISINRLLATFLAILELTRLSKLYLEQIESFGDILCKARES
jgi:segregation and condensation protein A